MRNEIFRHIHGQTRLARLRNQNVIDVNGENVSSLFSLCLFPQLLLSLNQDTQIVYDFDSCYILGSKLIITSLSIFVAFVLVLFSLISYFYFSYVLKIYYRLSFKAINTKFIFRFSYYLLLLRYMQLQRNRDDAKNVLKITADTYSTTKIRTRRVRATGKTDRT